MKRNVIPSLAIFALTLVTLLVVRATSTHAPVAATTIHAATPHGVFSPAVTQQLDAAIAQIVRENNLPSVAVGISVPGKGEYRYVTGLADLPSRAARRFDQPFRIASITKAFVAAAVLQLLDRGR